MSAWGWGVPSAVDPLVAEVERLRKTAPEQQAKIDALAAALMDLLAVEDDAEVIPAQCRAQAVLRAIGRIP